MSAYRTHALVVKTPTETPMLGLRSMAMFGYAYERLDHTADGCIVSTYRFTDDPSGGVDVRRIDQDPFDIESVEYHTIPGDDDSVYDAAHDAMLVKHGGRAS